MSFGLAAASAKAGSFPGFYNGRVKESKNSKEHLEKSFSQHECGCALWGPVWRRRWNIWNGPLPEMCGLWSRENKQLRLGWLYNTCHQLLTETAIKPLDSLGDYVHHQGRHHNNTQVADEFVILLWSETVRSSWRPSPSLPALDHVKLTTRRKSWDDGALPEAASSGRKETIGMTGCDFCVKKSFRLADSTSPTEHLLMVNSWRASTETGKPWWGADLLMSTSLNQNLLRKSFTGVGSVLSSWRSASEGEIPNNWRNTNTILYVI